MALILHAFPGFTYRDLRGLTLREIEALVHEAKALLSVSAP